jgi:hypothetical protein
MFQKFKDLFLNSNFLQGKSHAVKLAFVGMITAVNIVANALLEFKTLDVQFSFTILTLVLTNNAGFLVAKQNSGAIPDQSVMIKSEE